MSGFTALNAEPEDSFEEEVDDTKEIQIEEAFKLYQNALKLHSQGPQYFDAAEQAYQELFQSEVFRYPEAVTDYGHEQLDDTVALPTPAIDHAPVAIIPSNATDSAADSLPQLIYLSFKNRGQFVLDVARHQLDLATSERRAASLYYYQYCLKSLEDSASALERDDTDLDLWKKAARISDVLSSQRLVRYCLESVVAGDDETGEQTIDLSGLDEAFASGELLKVLQLIQDDVAVVKSSTTQAQNTLLDLLQKSNDPYPFLPHRASSLEHLHENQKPNVFEVNHITIHLEGHNHAAFAEALAQCMSNSMSGTDEASLGAFASVILPSSMSENTSPEEEEPAVANSVQKMDQLNNVVSREEQLDTASLGGSAHSPASYHSAQDEVKPEPDVDEAKVTHLEQKQSEDPTVENEIAVQEVDRNGSLDQAVPELRLPTRKRSSVAAGMDEPESRTKSKRLRARESMMEVAAHEEETTQVNDYYIREQLAVIEDADTACITYVNGLLSKLGGGRFLRIDLFQDTGEADGLSKSPRSRSDINELSEDLKEALNQWTEETSAAVISGHGSRDIVERSGGMALFQRHLKGTTPREASLSNAKDDDGTLVAFIKSLNQSEHTLADISIQWLVQLLSSKSQSDNSGSPYLGSFWPSEMRDDVLHVLKSVDGMLLNQVLDLARSTELASASSKSWTLSKHDISVEQAAELTQTIFEIQLDEYYGMTNPGSQSDEPSKAEQKDRMERWSHAVTEAMQIYVKTTLVEANNQLVLRFLLASALFAGLLAGDDKAHVLSCLADVRTVLEQADGPVIILPNNKLMPQVSVPAIDQEISRLSTLDFFNSIFDSDNSDPVSIITKLEPVLEPESVIDDDESQSDGTLANRSHTKMTELQEFLDSGDASLKLFLWRRLQGAYTTISYTPKVVSCLLRSLEVIVQEISSERHRSMKPPEGQLAMLRWLRDADDLMTKILARMTDETKAFETLDEDHLLSSISAVTTLISLLYAFIKYDDSVRVGQVILPSLRTSSAMKALEKARDRLRDGFVRSWTLLYHLLSEATIQLRDCFERPVDQLAEYLRLVHSILGYRQYCKHCNKIFIKLAKSELLSIRSDIDYSEDIAQILYDMYQIKLGTGFGDMNHGCTGDPLGRDKETAFHLVPVIVGYARKMNMKDLIKSDLKGTIERIQQTLGQVKTSPALSSNRKAVSSYLKSPINPQDVYRSLKGMGDLLTKPVGGDYAKIASLGWYQMLGSMSLAKYKSIKRVNPTPTDDLDTAATFLRLDLEHDIANWESWYRLAQVFDCKIEDSLIWNALKINDSRGEIATLERSAINSYTMAIAMAMRNANDSMDTVQKISDMFAEFALRLYASSRPPLSMEVFNTDKYMRHLSSSQDQSMSKAPFIFPFKQYAVWAFAAYLLQRKFASGQKEWLCYYSLGKCLWKMYQSSDNMTNKKPITIEDVLDAFTDAVETVPAKEKATDYILEPHYKLVSIVHKLVNSKRLSHTKGVEYLQATPFARSVHLSQEEQDFEWDDYILEILRKLAHADKSNWHHRITVRAAHVNYDDNPTVAGALGAKHQLTQQIFTKTMAMQVWKPEYERPGRHYVYTGRYLSFFVHLLDRLNDRGSMEQLVRRIRRKTTDFLDHPKVWEETALTYVNLLRRVGKIPDGKERDLFDKTSYDDFSKMSERVEKWAHDPENTSPFQDIVQDAIELKKLNNSLMKGPAIDDLIGDAYACMYEAFVAQLPPEEVAPPVAAILPQGTFINMSTDVVPTGDDNLDRMRLNNLLSAQTDGTAGAVTPVSSAIGLGLSTPQNGSPPPEPVRIPTPSKPGRIKTITRREVQRKAEACLVKPPPIKTPTLVKRPFIDIPGRRDSGMSNVHENTENERSNDDAQLDDSRAGSRLPSASVRNSAEPDDVDRDADNDGEGDDEHDGEADDESELSDVENDADENASRTGESRRSTFSVSTSRKRKADDEEQEEEETGVEEGDEDQEDEEEEEDEENEEHDGNETGAEPEAEPEKDEMDVDEVEDSVMEVQDSQEPSVIVEPVKPIEIPQPVADTPKSGLRSSRRKT